jgi:parallel beta-helix repeat protein
MLMTTYYVSSIVGSDNNAGASASAPLASLQAAANLVKPGDTVLVMNGTYSAPYYGDALDITTSGTASAPITFAAAPGETPVIDSSGGWNAINIEASYITVKGFTIVGDAANYTLTSALAGYSAGSSELDGNGIAINPGSGASLPNHITIENNTVYNEPGGGIYTEGADYVQILNNVVHNNANWSAFGNSGISVSTSANLDQASGAHIVVSGNLAYNNASLVPTDGAGKITDGEGIILDTNPSYTSEILVQNNIVYNNGSSGIESFLTDGALITGNTVYGNNVGNVQAASVAQVFINQSNNDTVTNNDGGTSLTSAADFVLREFQAAWAVFPTETQYENWVARIIANPLLENGGMSQALAGTPECQALYGGTTSATEPATQGFVTSLCNSLLGIPPGRGALLNVGLPVWQVLQNFAQSSQFVTAMPNPIVNFQNALLESDAVPTPIR